MDRKYIAAAVVLALLLVGGGIAIFTSGSAPLNAPTNLNAVVEGEEVVLTWDPPSNAEKVEGYRIYRSTFPGELGLALNEEPLKDTLFRDSPLPGKVYYYTVRAVYKEGEDDNLNQVRVEVKALPPTMLKLNINNGAEYTNSREVILNLFAKNAAKCRFRNEGKDWSNYMPYNEVVEWKLEDEGEVTVEMQCVREVGDVKVESEVVSDSIIADFTPPSVTLQNVELEEGKIKFDAAVDDNLDETLECVVSAEDIPLEQFTSPADTLEVELPPGTYNVFVSCSDDAGNVGFALYPVEGLENENYEGPLPASLSLKINNDEEITNNTTVNLTISAVNWNPTECRFANEDSYPVWETPWLPFVMNYEWTLSEGDGLKTVYVECRNETNESLIASDTIIYRISSDGSDGSGGDGGGEVEELRLDDVKVYGFVYADMRNNPIEFVGKRDASAVRFAQTPDQPQPSLPYDPGIGLPSDYIDYQPIKSPRRLIPVEGYSAVENIKIEVEGRGISNIYVWQESPVGLSIPGYNLGEQNAKRVDVLSSVVEIPFEVVPRKVIKLPTEERDRGRIALAVSPPPSSVPQPVLPVLGLVFVPDGERIIHIKAINDRGEEIERTVTLILDQSAPLFEYVNAQPIVEEAKICFDIPMFAQTPDQPQPSLPYDPGDEGKCKKVMDAKVRVGFYVRDLSFDSDKYLKNVEVRMCNKETTECVVRTIGIVRQPYNVIDLPYPQEGGNFVIEIIAKDFAGNVGRTYYNIALDPLTPAAQLPVIEQFKRDVMHVQPYPFNDVVRDVKVNMFVKVKNDDAERCRVGEIVGSTLFAQQGTVEEIMWSNWVDYRKGGVKIPFIMVDRDGLHRLVAQCENDVGLSNLVYYEILRDSEKPQIRSLEFFEYQLPGSSNGESYVSYILRWEATDLTPIRFNVYSADVVEVPTTCKTPPCPPAYEVQPYKAVKENYFDNQLSVNTIVNPGQCYKFKLEAVDLVGNKATKETDVICIKGKKSSGGTSEDKGRIIEITKHNRMEEVE